MADLRQFRQFVAVAEELNFRKAAERLRMAQPPLTVAIQGLEAEVGATLIERSNRVTKLTEAGQQFLDGARRTLLQAERAMRVAQRAGADLTGLLRITFAPSVSRGVLPPILREFRRRHPEVQLELVEAMTTRQVSALREDRADVGFVVPPLRDADDLTCVTVARDSMVVALPQDHRLARAKAVALSDLADEPWVFFPGRQAPGLHQRVHAACTQAGFVPRVAQEALQMETIVSLVAAGLGVSLVTRVIAMPRHQGVVFRPPRGVGAPVDYELAMAYGAPTPMLRAFEQVVQSFTVRR